MQPPIALSGLVLETPLLADTGAFYADHFGLQPEWPSEREVALSVVAAAHPPLVLRHGAVPRLAALSFAYPHRQALARAQREADAAGLGPRAGGDGFAVLDPDGCELRFHIGSDASSADRSLAIDRPLFMSHVVVNSPEPERLVAFYRDRLGFAVTDRYEKGLLTFLKCDQRQHHCVGVAPAERAGLNHFAMDCGTLDALMRGISRMRSLGHEPLWGPGRHGPGGNIFCYFEDPAGFVPEYTCDVMQIEDDADWVPAEWKRTPENANVWLSGGPPARAVALMSGGPDAAGR